MLSYDGYSKNLFLQLSCSNISNQRNKKFHISNKGRRSHILYHKLWLWTPNEGFWILYSSYSSSPNSMLSSKGTHEINRVNPLGCPVPTGGAIAMREHHWEGEWLRQFVRPEQCCGPWSDKSVTLHVVRYLSPIELNSLEIVKTDSKP